MTSDDETLMDSSTAGQPAELPTHLHAERMRVGTRTSHLEPMLLDRLHCIRANFAAILEMDGDILQPGGDRVKRCRAAA